MRPHNGIELSYITLNRVAEKKGKPTDGIPLLSDARKLPDEDLTASLNGFGITVDRELFKDWCGRYRSAQHLADDLSEEHEVQNQDFNRLWFCVTLLWERWFPDIPNLEMIDDKMQLGYEKLEKSSVEACVTWLSYWRDVRRLMDMWNIRSISQFDEVFSQTQFLINWCQDFEMELGNAAIEKDEYNQVRLTYCRELIPLLAGESALVRQNMMRAIAEAYFNQGDSAGADALYEEWLAEEPDWGWGWIGWSDLYSMGFRRKADSPKAERILTEALKNPVLDDRFHVLERLYQVYEQGENTLKMAEIDKQMASLKPQEHETRSAPADPDEWPPSEAPLEKRKKVGRNEPCPCGSGKKYKRCCGG